MAKYIKRSNGTRCTVCWKTGTTETPVLTDGGNDVAFVVTAGPNTFFANTRRRADEIVETTGGDIHTIEDRS